MRVMQRARMQKAEQVRRHKLRYKGWTVLTINKPLHTFYLFPPNFARIKTPFDGLPMDGKDGAIINDVLADLERDSKPPR
jgi:hypothetical protein